MNRCFIANSLWQVANFGRARAFRKSLQIPGEAQRRVLLRILRRNRKASFGRRYGFDDIDSVERFQERVPIVSYDDLASVLDRIRRGEPGVLTEDPVVRLVPSSGSTAACKLIPYTRGFQAEMNNAIGPWICDLFGADPDLKRGPAYWSISPALDAPHPDSVIPIGFETDSAYLGGILRRLVDAVVAAPSCLRYARDPDLFAYLTLLHLLAERELRIVSVWHPSFFLLLLDAFAKWRGRLVKDIAHGTVDPPGEMDPRLPSAVTGGFRPDPARASEVAHLDPDFPGDLWPSLGLLSCWAHGPAESAAKDLAARFPQARLQPKGLMATEGVVTVPFEAMSPVAVTSHFYEFIEPSGRVRTVDSLDAGMRCEIVLTTGAGLYRYRLGDLVEVNGFSGKTPSLRFIGRGDRVSDLRGEKLSEGHVADALRLSLRETGVAARFAMLAPEPEGATAGYILYLQTDDPPAPELGTVLDRRLSENPHYGYCRRLGQLEAVKIFSVRGDAHALYIERFRRHGTRLGDIKPSALSVERGWKRIFSGAKGPASCSR